MVTHRGHGNGLAQRGAPSRLLPLLAGVQPMCRAKQGGLCELRAARQRNRREPGGVRIGRRVMEGAAAEGDHGRECRITGGDVR
eukprot:5781298-Prymnesium_polylepis.1